MALQPRDQKAISYENNNGPRGPSEFPSEIALPWCGSQWHRMMVLGTERNPAELRRRVRQRVRAGRPKHVETLAEVLVACASESGEAWRSRTRQFAARRRCGCGSGLRRRNGGAERVGTTSPGSAWVGVIDGK